MADARKCDACGKYYDVNQRYETSGRVRGGILKGIVTIDSDSGCTDKYFDLCDDCMGHILGFVHEAGGDADE